MMSDPHVKQRAKRYAKALSNMTDKTYTQTEVDALIAAEREAVLRKAAEKLTTKSTKVLEKYDTAPTVSARLVYRHHAEALAAASNIVISLIDQPTKE